MNVPISERMRVILYDKEYKQNTTCKNRYIVIIEQTKNKHSLLRYRYIVPDKLDLRLGC